MRNRQNINKTQTEFYYLISFQPKHNYLIYFNLNSYEFSTHGFDFFKELRFKLNNKPSKFPRIQTKKFPYCTFLNFI